ncbi:MAG: hypothetical protein P8N02_13505 [Actinomycetota bacterium]|jgi:hypothetical protein|nr:hypothetical protein [Actinomycetota bacterium]
MTPNAWHVHLTGKQREHLLGALRAGGNRGAWAFVDLDVQTVELLIWEPATPAWLDQVTAPASLAPGSITTATSHSMAPGLFPGGTAPGGYLPTLAELSWRSTAALQPAISLDDLVSGLAMVHHHLAADAMADSVRWHLEWLATIHEMHGMAAEPDGPAVPAPQPDNNLQQLGRDLRSGCRVMQPRRDEAIPFEGTVMTATVARLAHIHAVQLSAGALDPHSELQAVIRLLSPRGW